jgi:AcrR family transcriptional regulator
MVETAGPAPARKRGRPTEHERTQRLDEILDAAVRLFVAEGFEAVTLDHIAAAAKVAKRTIYTYLGDRTEVFLAAIERLRERALHETQPSDGLAQLAETIVRTLHSDAAVGLHRLVIAEAGRFPDLARRFYDEGPGRYIAALRERLGKEQKDRAEALFGLLLGEAHRERLLGLRAAPDETAARAHARAALSLLSIADEREGAAP